MAANATQLTVAGTDGSTYSLAADGGMESVKPTATTTYTATATGAGGKTSATAIVTVVAGRGADRQHHCKPHVHHCGKFVHR